MTYKVSRGTLNICSINQFGLLKNFDMTGADCVSGCGIPLMYAVYQVVGFGGGGSGGRHSERRRRNLAQSVEGDSVAVSATRTM